MKDLYVITHQHGEGAKLRYYCSLQNNLGDVLAETNEYTTPDGCKSAVEELLPMLRGYAQSRMMGEACILGKYYYHRLLVNNIPVLRTRTCSSRADSEKVWLELLECVQGEILYYDHIKDRKGMTLHFDPKVLNYMHSLNGQGQHNILNYTTQTQWENPASWLYDTENGKMHGLYHRLFQKTPRRHGADYTVTFRTGLDAQAGTDANVFLTLYGMGLDGKLVPTKEFRLHHDLSYFEPQGVDVFHLSLDEDPGDLKQIRIRHDNTYHPAHKQSADWFLMDVTIQKDGTNRKWVFPCNQWLRVTGTEKTNDVILTPAVEGYRSDPYRVQLRFRDCDFADGEDSRVYLRLQRQTFMTKEYQLPGTLRSIYEDQSDGVILYVNREVPDLDQIVLRFDNPRAWKRCRLREVIVENCFGKTFSFPYEGELTAPEKGELTVRIFAGPYDDSETVYLVHIKTGDLPNHGMTAGAYIKLYGENGDSGEQALVPVDQDFWFGRRSTFRIGLWEDIGDLRQIKLGLSDSKKEWYPEEVVIEKMEYNQTWRFPCLRWLSATRDGGRTERILEAVPDGKEPVRYWICVRTGGQENAGTTANVLITLCGEDGRSVEDFELGSLKQGSECSFQVTVARELGEISTIRIRHDGSGKDPGWYLEDVTVKQEDNQKLWYFPCARWLDQAQEDGLTDRYLNMEPGRTGPLCYRLQVQTGDQFRAGTSSRVYATLFGTDRSTSEHRLDNPGKEFQAGKTDTFTIKQVWPLGELSALRIRHDDTGLFPGWYLKDVRAERTDTGEVWYFPCEQWLDKDQGDGLMDRTLRPAADRTGALTYLIHVKTGDLSRAGTNARVFITLSGTAGSSPEVRLNDFGNDFRKGKTDTFRFLYALDLGELESIRIRHDDSGLLSGWYLEDVTVEIQYTERSWYFPCDRWLATDQDDGQIDLTLNAAGKKPEKGGSEA